MSETQAAPAPAALAPAARPGDVGRFVHHDLMAYDPEAARAFYGGLLGWEFTTRDVGGFTYTDVRTSEGTGNRVVGGMVPLDPAHGIPSHWMGYVAVDDVAAACARATEAGGAVRVPPHAMPDGGGTFAVLQDPGGAYVSVLHLTRDAGEPAPDDVPGGLWWHELLTADAAAAARFYAHVFGWEARVMLTMPDGAPYHTLHHAGRTVGGLVTPPCALPHGAWHLYFVVDDVDAAVARAVALGGAVDAPPRDVPGVGRMAGLVDPSGAHFSVGRAQ